MREHRAKLVLMDSPRKDAHNLDDLYVRGILHTDGISVDFKFQTPKLIILERNPDLLAVALDMGKPGYEYPSQKQLDLYKSAFEKRAYEIRAWLEMLKNFFKFNRPFNSQDDENLTKVIELRRYELNLIQMCLPLLRQELVRRSQSGRNNDRRSRV